MLRLLCLSYHDLTGAASLAYRATDTSINHVTLMGSDTEKFSGNQGGVSSLL